ncbi:MAG: D-glycero-beta-D-manno-heptose-1,7-bisphosphate 7-phosphatase [Sulfurospirillum sp.]|nr:MAG: D-glycero-beta-D-manno-heptose-1,7-bisphosphate 7-phosphatase [Sulfurospirillum sp.]
MSSRRDRAIFLDRDGVINIDKEYLYKIEDFEFVDGIFDLIKSFQESGYMPIVVTNQSGIARGYYTQEDYMKLSEFMVNEFLKKGIKIEAVYHCPHSPDDDCRCRKPRSGMFSAAKSAFKLDMKNSIMIGDKDSDMLAALRAKVGRRVLFGKDKISKNATEIAESLKEIRPS